MMGIIVPDFSTRGRELMVLPLFTNELVEMLLED
jgi:hypothetical protein